MLQDLRTFLTTRARQSKNQAFLIRKYIEMPNRFRSGGKQYTEAEAVLYDKDAAECEMLLKQLTTSRTIARKTNQVPSDATAADICVFCQRDQQIK